MLSLIVFSYHTPDSKPPTLFLKHHRNIPALEVHNDSSLCLEWSAHTWSVWPAHYFLNTSAQIPCSLTVLLWPSSLNISPSHHVLSYPELFFTSLIATWDITGLSTLCLVSLERRVAHKSRDFSCSLLFSSFWCGAWYNTIGTRKNWMERWISKRPKNMLVGAWILCR